MFPGHVNSPIRSQGKECHVSWGWIAANVDLRVRGAGDKRCPAAGAWRSRAPRTVHRASRRGLLPWGQESGRASRTTGMRHPLGCGQGRRPRPGGSAGGAHLCGRPRGAVRRATPAERDPGQEGHENAKQLRRGLLGTRSRYHLHSRCSCCNPSRLQQRRGWPLRLGMI